VVDEIKVPLLPESVNDAVISKWCVEAGASVQEGDIIAELETDKIVLEVPAPSAGMISGVSKTVGDRVEAGDVLCALSASAQPQSAKEEPNTPSTEMDTEYASDVKEESDTVSAGLDTEHSGDVDVSKSKAHFDSDKATDQIGFSEQTALEQIRLHRALPSAGPSARRMMHQHDIDVSAVQPNASGRVQQSDVAAQVDVSSSQPSDVQPSSLKQSKPSQDSPFADRQEREVPMTRLRQTIAQRLLDSQRLTASLTTFNELDMTKVMDLRKRYQADFTEKYGVKLGFMSFFTKACCRALQAFPEVNASVRESNIVYHDYCDIGIAVSTEKGLVVPIIRDADQLEMDEIEQQILDYSGRAKSNKLTLDDLSGGTFSITNGGVFGSMLSTPILNPPQSAILGMHNIVKRPVVVDNAIQIRPMMYLALTYDHRMIDGSQAVQFLVMVKDLLEDPDRLLLQV
tara:strand:- start:157 stop:1527 length:1371 start_codon:yes stop_codon:yes gene_type:complete